MAHGASHGDPVESEGETVTVESVSSDGAGVDGHGLLWECGKCGNSGELGGGTGEHRAQLRRRLDEIGRADRTVPADRSAPSPVRDRGGASADTDGGAGLPVPTAHPDPPAHGPSPQPPLPAPRVLPQGQVARPTGMASPMGHGGPEFQFWDRHGGRYGDWGRGGRGGGYLDARRFDGVDYTRYGAGPWRRY